MKVLYSLVLLVFSQVAWAETGRQDVAVAVFAGGCFWCMEPPYDKLEGVVSTTSGYIGGFAETATYKKVSAGGTKHYEAVQIEYDPDKVSYEKLLDVFWVNVDPFDAKGQFCDKGAQYLSGIFYLNDKQQKLAMASLSEIQKRFDKPIVTDVHPASTFYPAEEYHQNYYQKNPIRYKFYRTTCGRDGRLEDIWEE